MAQCWAYVTAGLAGRLNLEQWRRAEIRPVLEQVVALSREAHMAWPMAAAERARFLGNLC